MLFMKEGLEARIREHIKQDGPISFAEYMEIALYDQEEGYYVTPSVGRDYYTSPSAHPVFGALVAIQLEEIWSLIGQPESFPVVELGAGRGTLGRDIRDYALNISSDFAEAIDYIPVEKHWGKIPELPIEGCFISNEFMDALPTHIVVKKDGSIKEVMVTIQGDSLTEILMDPLPGVLKHLDEELNVGPEKLVLTEGYRTEVNLEAPRWMAAVAKALNRGIVLTIDYGYSATELYSPERRKGTLLCYHQHTYNEEPLQQVGCQDITTHVDFTALIRTGEKKGLSTKGFITQREFLNNLGIQHYIRALGNLGLSSLEYQANLYAIQELIRSEGMGSFRVLLQTKRMEGAKFKSLQKETDSRYKPPTIVPKLRLEHLPLYQAKYSLSEKTIGEEISLWPPT